MRIKSRHLALAGAAFTGLFLAFHKPKGSGPGGQRVIGDKAKVGDEVHVPITSLPAPVPGLPAGAGLINLKVSGATPDMLSGMVVGYIVHELPNLQLLPLPVPIGPITIARTMVTSVVRAGREVA